MRLDQLSKQDILEKPFPVKQLITNSLYYPSSGFDGGVIKDCNTKARDLKIQSFIYCDYATGYEKLKDQLNSFRGYHVFASRPVSKDELTPNGWQPKLPPRINQRQYTRFRSTWKPFISWTVYERDEEFDADHGPSKFSLLYLGGEGVATYQALYWSNETAAKALAIIQPGTGFGLNWTDYTKPDGPLAWVVTNNPHGTPTILYYGGYLSNYDDLKWEGYHKERVVKPYYPSNKGEVGIWRYNYPPN